MKIVGESTIVMATKDNDVAMSKFYIDVLGFTHNPQTGAHDLGNFHLYFDRHSNAEVKSKEPFRHMLTFNVENVKEAADELKLKGVTFIRELGKEEWGGVFSTFEDPDGNYLQLFEMPAH